MRQIHHAIFIVALSVFGCSCGCDGYSSPTGAPIAEPELVDGTFGVGRSLLWSWPVANMTDSHEDLVKLCLGDWLAFPMNEMRYHDLEFGQVRVAPNDELVVALFDIPSSTDMLLAYVAVRHRGRWNLVWKVPIMEW